MAMTPEEIDALPDYTDAQLLKLYRKALAECPSGKSVTIAGRTLTRENLPEIRETVGWLESRISAASIGSAGGGIALVQFGDAQ